MRRTALLLGLVATLLGALAAAATAAHALHVHVRGPDFEWGSYPRIQVRRVRPLTGPGREGAAASTAAARGSARAQGRCRSPGSERTRRRPRVSQYIGWRSRSATQPRTTR